MTGAGAAAFLLARLMLPLDPAIGRKRLSFDIPGTLLLALSLGALALATTPAGGATGPIRAELVGVAIIGFSIFVAVEARTASPLVDMTLLRDRALRAGFASMGLISTIMMATLVVGPFYLSEVLGLDPVNVGLVMSIGPGVAALAGIPAGHLVDRLGARVTAVAGLIGVAMGSLLMAFLPALLGTGGYGGGLALMTAGYALFQAANNTSVIGNAASDRRGVTSALLGLSRNLGLIMGASAMGALFSLGSRAVWLPGIGSGGEAGMRLTFTAAAGLATIALVLALRGRSDSHVARPAVKGNAGGERLPARFSVPLTRSEPLASPSARHPAGPKTNNERNAGTFR
jgi:Na+/melibiose symporter-like transporter